MSRLFSGGEYHNPDAPLTPEKRRALSLFLSEVRDVEPQVLLDLWEKVMPAFRRDRSRGNWRARWANPGEDTLELQEQLHSWADRYNLNSDWLWIVAISTCDQWNLAIEVLGDQRIPSDDERARTRGAPNGFVLDPLDWWEPWKLGPAVEPADDAVPPLSEDLAGENARFGFFMRTSSLDDAPVLKIETRWDPLMEERDAFTERHNEKFEAYVATVEKGVAARKLVRASRKREREHFRWLARRVVLEDSPIKIAREELGESAADIDILEANRILEAERKRIDEAVRATAALVDIELPWLRKGRLSGAATNHS